jgi:hypothetical protein
MQGLKPRPGKAQVFVYPECSEGHVVADVIRLDKGHTEGLEPVATWNRGLGPTWYPIALAVLAIPQCSAGGRLYVMRSHER